MLRSSFRRTSTVGSSQSLAGRRSSVNQRDIERIQHALLKSKRDPTRWLVAAMIVSPLFIFFYHYVVVFCHGSLFTALVTNEPEDWISGLPNVFSRVGWIATATIVALQLLFAHALPADEVKVLSADGQKLKKRINGFSSCLLICLLYVLGAGMGLYRGNVLFVHWHHVMGALTVSALLVVLFAWAKTTTESFEFVADFYYGFDVSEFGADLDLRHLVLTRLVMTLWPLYVISALYEHCELHGRFSDPMIACSALQLVYVAKHMWYEHLALRPGTAGTEKAGFYRFWMTTVFMVTVYVTPVGILAHSTKGASRAACVLVSAANLLFQYVRIDVDVQKYEFRIADGNIKVWGDRDPFFINAKCRNEAGEATMKLLLGSGYWGIVRHPNYPMEVLTFASWCFFTKSSCLLPYFPAIFMGVFLLLRMSRIENECLAKYAHYWIQYTSRVQFRMIPGVY
ncbi:hypothetical protein QR680_005200 [Steinernema hermaphroditum]|uniref:7-dehydrocholesterol reductase n=1 Tax=Steinernema hermaphroditum TaxID=289476 RepID=A0AA39LUY4_9BILA|nr:hypothetical protein QR680_005200 [Steinernema hermaphroditum]